jgi:hypothetical protein
MASVLSRLKVFLATREDAWRYPGQMTLVVDRQRSGCMSTGFDTGSIAGTLLGAAAGVVDDIS